MLVYVVSMDVFRQKSGVLHGVDVCLGTVAVGFVPHFLDFFLADRGPMDGIVSQNEA